MTGAILKVQTVAEAMQASASAVLISNEVPGASPDSHSVTVRSGPMPLRLPLQQYFSKNGLREETADPVASLSNGAVTLSRNIMAEAWALRRLAERYRGNRKDNLPPYARLLLQNMVQDHMSSLRLGVEKARHLLEPALSSLFSDEPASRGRLCGPMERAEFGARPVSIYLVELTKSEGLSMRSSPVRSQRSSPRSWRADFWNYCPAGEANSRAWKSKLPDSFRPVHPALFKGPGTAGRQTQKRLAPRGRLWPWQVFVQWLRHSPLSPLRRGTVGGLQR